MIRSEDLENMKADLQAASVGKWYAGRLDGKNVGGRGMIDYEQLYTTVKGMAEGEYKRGWNDGYERGKEEMEKGYMGQNRIVYIAGKITGNPKYFEQFAKAQGELERDGHIVLNPALLPKGIPSEKALPICMTMIEQADAVYCLKTWPSSPGAGIEKAYARYLGLPIIHEIDGIPGLSAMKSEHDNFKYGSLAPGIANAPKGE